MNGTWLTSLLLFLLAVYSRHTATAQQSNDDVRLPVDFTFPEVPPSPSSAEKEAAANANPSSTSTQCPAGSFRCGRAPASVLCIPDKWKCDGGDDCQDGDAQNGIPPSDEDPAICNTGGPVEGRKPPPPASLVQITGGGAEVPVTTTESLDYFVNELNGHHDDTRPSLVQLPPNLQAAGRVAARTTGQPPVRLPDEFTFPPVPASPDNGPPPFPQGASPDNGPPPFPQRAPVGGSAAEGQCTDEERRIVSKCMSAPFMSGVNVDKSFAEMHANIPVALDPVNSRVISQVCSVFDALKQCLGSLAFQEKDCLSGTIANASYATIEMYACQLVIPSLQDPGLQSCLTTPECIAISNQANQPGQEQTAPEQGKEVCTFLSTVRGQLDCSLPHADCSNNEILLAILAETQALVWAFQQNHDCDVQQEVENGAGGTPVGDEGCPLEQLIFASCVSHIAPLGQLANKNESRNSFMVPPDQLKVMCTGVAGYKQCRNELTNGKDCPLSPAETQLFTTVDPVVAVFCGDDLQAEYNVHVQCLESVAGTEKGQECERESKKISQEAKDSGEVATACDIVTNLEKSVDCVKAIALEMCPQAEKFLGTLQQRIDQQVISNDCFDEYPAEYGDYGQPEDDRPKFKLTPNVPKCTEKQELKGAGCLFGLVSLAQEFPKFKNVDLIVEVSKNDSELLTKVCKTYSKFDACTQRAFALANDGQRCAFGAPLIIAARVGLSQFCDNNTQAELQANRWCMEKLKGSPELSKCTDQLQILGPMINRLLSEGNPALVCELFYKIRLIFECVKVPVFNTCGEEPVAALISVQNRLSGLAEEEGCPAVRPENFDEYLLPPPTRKPERTTTAAAPSRQNVNPDYFNIIEPVSDGITTTAAGLFDGDCSFEGQQLLFDCLTPMVELEGHPFLLIEDPRNVSKACDALGQFETCKHNPKCRPSFVEGTVASWKMVCGSEQGRSLYDKYSPCLKTVADMPEVANCTRKFVGVSDATTCKSAKELYKCTKPYLEATCDMQHSSYLEQFLTVYGGAQGEACNMASMDIPVPVVEPDVSTSPDSPVPEPEPSIDNDTLPLTPISCSEDEHRALGKCQEPAMGVVERLKELFKGGLQGFVTKAEELGKIFAAGCDVGTEVKQCAAGIVNVPGTSCQVSSCLIKAGDGICDKPDREQTINKHLQCVFQLITFQPFGRCLGLLVNNRQAQAASTEEVSLEELRQKLTPFLRCASPIIRNRCGEEPLQVLKAMAAEKESCPLDLSNIEVIQPFVVPETAAEPSPEPTTAPEPKPEPEPLPVGTDAPGSLSQCSSNPKHPLPCQPEQDKSMATKLWYYHPLYHMCLVIRTCEDVSPDMDVFSSWSQCTDSCIPQDSFQCAFKAPPYTDENGETVICGQNVPNAGECPESHACVMGPFFGICCNDTLQQHFNTAVRPQCGDGTPAIPFKDANLGDFYMPILGVSCGIDSPCNADHVCYHNGVFSYCCADADESTCADTDMQAHVERCIRQEIGKRGLYKFVPWALTKPRGVDACEMVDGYTRCLNGEASGCGAPDDHPATRMHRVMNATCAQNRKLWEDKRECLRKAWLDAERAQCAIQYDTVIAEIEWNRADNLLPNKGLCDGLREAVKCSAQEVARQCGDEALAFAVNAMRLYAGGECEIDIPDVKTACKNDDNFKQQLSSCGQTDFSQWKLEPVTLHVSPSETDVESVCQKFNSEYATCIDSLDCAVDNQYIAVNRTYKNICTDEWARRKMTNFKPCIDKMVATDEGQKCIEGFEAAWQLASESTNSSIFCEAMNNLLSCMAVDARVYSECGMRVVIQMYQLHTEWVQLYDSRRCNLHPPQIGLSSLDVCQGVACENGETCSRRTDKPSNCSDYPCTEYTCDGGAAAVTSVPEPEPPITITIGEPEPEPTSTAADPCSGNKCSIGHVCVPESRQCVRAPCPQYVCIDGAGNAVEPTVEPEPEPEQTTPEPTKTKTEPEPTTEPTSTSRLTLPTKKPQQDPDAAGAAASTDKKSGSHSLLRHSSSTVVRIGLFISFLLTYMVHRVHL